MNTTKKQLPTAMQTFADIRAGNYYYVDKTKYLVELAKERAVFLSRPRRFGKSLTLETLDEMFSGNESLFSGLYAENNWDWKISFPVIRISLAEWKINSIQHLEDKLRSQLAKNAEKFDLTLGDAEYIGELFEDLIGKVIDKFQLKVVILIDDYDKPLLDNLNKAYVSEMRDMLRDFYSVIKGLDAYIRFSMLTGVSQFSKVSIFSGINNLHDISFMQKYSAICGYTQAELEEVFAPKLQDVDMESLKLWYHGYNWTGESVYNPYDVLLFLEEQLYKAHWFATGSAIWLVDKLATHRLNMHDIESIHYDESDLSKFNIDEMHPISILYQAGYLTIHQVKQYPMGVRYTLQYPNMEVQQSLNKALLNKYLPINYPLANEQLKLYQYLKEENFEEVEMLFHYFYVNINKNQDTDIINDEKYYASVFYGLLTGLGSRVYCEDNTNQGGMDVWFDFEKTIYIVEFKMVENKAELATKDLKAIQKIKDKNYIDKFTNQQAERNKPIILMGVVFGKEQSNIIGFEVEKLSFAPRVIAPPPLPSE